LKRRVWIASFVGLLGVLSVLTSPRRSSRADDPLFVGAKIDPQVLSIIERSCRDCHSEATHYPWYSYVAPVSFLIQWDVSGGRKHLNFSQWSEYPVARRERNLSEIANQVKDGDMPLPQYLWIHRNAKLSQADINAIFQWTQAERARMIAENSGKP
jgi:hypothetical protein